MTLSCLFGLVCVIIIIIKKKGRKGMMLCCWLFCLLGYDVMLLVVLFVGVREYLCCFFCSCL